MRDELEELVCPRCEDTVTVTDAWCPTCGISLSDALRCARHPDRPAHGGCVACGRVGCRECGRDVHNIFLCTLHASYENYEGLARVYGTTDLVQAHHAAGMLEQAGLHPFIYSRARYPRPDVSPFLSFPQIHERTIPEQKVLVPFREITEAESVLRDLGLLTDRDSPGR